jgi:hypothetical protein
MTREKEINRLVFLVDKTHNNGEFPYGITPMKMPSWFDRGVLFLVTSELPYFSKKESF